MPAAPDVPTLLRDLQGDPGRPRLTWYGPDAERVELSGKVLGNWVAKTANLLVDELDAGPGTVVALDLPTHWRTVVWFLATWAAGAHAIALEAPGVAGPDAAARDAAGPDAAGPDAAGPEGADVVVTTDPARRRAAAHVVAVALPALATSFGPGLPAGAVDAAGEVRLQGDVFVPVARPGPRDAALTVAGTTLPHGELLAAARDGAARTGLAAGDRVFTGAAPDAVLTAWLGPLALDGSLVLHHDVAGLDPAARRSLRHQERVTADWDGPGR